MLINHQTLAQTTLVNGYILQTWMFSVMNMIFEIIIIIVQYWENVCAVIITLSTCLLMLRLTIPVCTICPMKYADNLVVLGYVVIKVILFHLIHVIYWCILSGLLLWHWGYHTVVPVPFITITSLWAQWYLKSPASHLFIQSFIQGAENIKALCHCPLCVEFTGDWWIPCTIGQ